MEEIRVYTLTEVVDILKVTRRTLHNYIKNGQLKAVRVGREWRVSHKNLQEFVESGTRRHK